MMRLHKIATTSVAFMALFGWLVSSGVAQTNTQLTRPPKQIPTKTFSETGTSALSRQMSSAVSRGDSPGLVALIVSRDGVLYQSAAGKLGVAHDTTMPTNAIFRLRP